MNIYFRPTYLYIKHHNVTGLKYFGKTVNNPEKYKGSGKVWQRHIKKHGNNVSTIWYRLFTNKDEIKKFALEFSKNNNIVESKEWANLKPEDGLWGGGVKGIKITPHSEEHKNRISQAILKHNLETGKTAKPKLIKTPVVNGWKWKDEARQKHSIRQIGIPKRRMCCIHCKTESAIANILQWHGDNCKKAPV